MTLQDLLEKLRLAALNRVPQPFKTNGMKKGVPIHD